MERGAESGGIEPLPKGHKACVRGLPSMTRPWRSYRVRTYTVSMESRESRSFRVVKVVRGLGYLEDHGSIPKVLLSTQRKGDPCGLSWTRALARHHPYGSSFKPGWASGRLTSYGLRSSIRPFPMWKFSINA